MELLIRFAYHLTERIKPRFIKFLTDHAYHPIGHRETGHEERVYGFPCLLNIRQRNRT